MNNKKERHFKLEQSHFSGSYIYSSFRDAVYCTCFHLVWEAYSSSRGLEAVRRALNLCISSQEVLGFLPSFSRGHHGLFLCTPQDGGVGGEACSFFAEGSGGFQGTPPCPLGGQVFSTVAPS